MSEATDGPDMRRGTQHGRMTPTISFTALQRSRTTIEDFVKSYFPYHKLDPTEDLFKFLDVLVFVEATIYQMDEENEALAATGSTNITAQAHGSSVLVSVLQDLGLLDDRIRQELTKGQAYWNGEQRCCAALLKAGDAVSRAECTDLMQVHDISQNKSFDYRVLHLLLHRLIPRNYDEPLLAFLEIDEHLVDIGDDLVDYEEDVARNSFNIYRVYVRLFNAQAPLNLIKYITALEARHRKALLQLPEEQQAHFHSRHQQAAVVPGSGQWVIPQPILDEDNFRRHKSKSSDVAVT